MNKFFKITILFLCLGYLTLFPLLVNAQIVPCGGSGQPPCQLCHFFILIRRIINFILMYIVPIAGVFILIGGVLILISRGAELAVQGKKMITYAIVGIVIALLSWTIINTIMVALVGGKFPMPWHEIDMDCKVVKIDLDAALITDYSLINDTSIPLNYSEANHDKSFIQVIKTFLSSIIKPVLAQVTPGVSPGDTIRYTATYTDISDEDLSNLVISIDYDETQISSITDISAGGIDDGSVIIWDIGDLDISQSVTVYFDFVLADAPSILQKLEQSRNNTNNLLTKILKKLSSSASAQSQSIMTAHYYNLITVSSNQAETESLNDPLQITLAVGLFAERQYYLITDADGDGEPSAGDKIRYNIKYFNPTPFAFNNVMIISDYAEGFVNITNIDGGGIDDNSKVTWNIGYLSEGDPSQDNPECIGFDFIIGQALGEFVIPNFFYITSEGGILETHNDILNVE